MKFMYSLKKRIPKKFKLGPLFKYETFIRELSTTLCERRKNEKMYFVVHCPLFFCCIMGEKLQITILEIIISKYKLKNFFGPEMKFLLSLGSMMT